MFLPENWISLQIYPFIYNYSNYIGDKQSLDVTQFLIQPKKQKWQFLLKKRVTLLGRNLRVDRQKDKIDVSNISNACYGRIWNEWRMKSHKKKVKKEKKKGKAEIISIRYNHN